MGLLHTHPFYQITPELTDKLIEGGVVMVVSALAFVFLILLVRAVFSPLVTQLVNGLKASNEGFQSVMTLGEAQHKTLELYANRLQQALDREEALTEKLRADNLILQADVARLEIQVNEQQRLRQEDLKRIRELEAGRSEDKTLLEEVNRKLKQRDQQITMLTDELEMVKKQREAVARERDERDKVIVDMQAQLDNLNIRLKAHEEKAGSSNSSGGSVEATS